MNHDDKKKRWATYVANLERRLTAAKKIQEILNDYPELADDLIRSFEQQPEVVPAAALYSSGNAPNGPNDEQSSGKSLRERIHEWLAKKNNAPTSAPEIMRALGAQRGAVSNVLYGKAYDDFEKASNPEGGGRVLWRLRQWPPSDSANGLAHGAHAN